MRAAIFVALLFCFQNTIAQRFGSNPSGIRWRQVNTPAARVIFPKGMDSIANRIATLAEALNQQQVGSIGSQQHKISIVLQAKNTYSNGYVQLAPWRSEFYLTSPQSPFSLGGQRWADNLAIHEFRHVEQYSNFNVGLSKFFSALLGEQGQAFANAVSIPDWFFEGDAVWNETAVSPQGRGRLPEFFNAYKSLQFDNKQYSYMKLRNGSFKNFVPNHYDLGYLLVSYGRQQYGDSIWQKITHDAAAFKGLFYPLQKAVKRHTGIDYSQFTNDAFKFYNQQWSRDSAQAAAPALQWLTKTSHNNVVNYQYPYPAANGHIIALKNSYRQIPVFVEVTPNGIEQKIAVKDIGYDDYFSYKNGRIIYTAMKPDARWGNRDYSIIKLLNVATGEVKSIGKRTKYFSPDVNNDGSQIVVVEANPANPCLLRLLDAEGNILKSFTADSSLFYSHPKFTADDKKIIVAARQPDGQMGWLQWDINSADFNWLLPPSNQLLGFPVVQGDSLLYTATAGSTDALYLLNTNTTSQPQMVANTPTGIYQGFVQNGQVTGASFTSNGYRLANIPLTTQTNSSKGLTDLYVAKTISGKPDLLNIATKKFPVTKFSKAHKLFNLHSWQPEISDPEYSVSVLGENVLSTLYSEFYYTYNRNEQTSQLGVRETFGGWYVQPFINANYTFQRPAQLNADTTLYYNNGQLGVGLQLPLNFSSGKMYRYFTLTSTVNTESLRWTGFAKGKYRNLDFNSWNVRLNYTAQIQKAAQQIYPRFAYTIQASYNAIINKYTANQISLNGALYLPGFYNSHNIVLTAAYQGRDSLQQFIFGNTFPFSRGYESINYPRMFRLGANYHFPIVYPDWGFGQMVYFKRIRGNVFFDYTVGKSISSVNSYYKSVGSEVYFDVQVWNQLPLTIGVRYTRLLDNEYRGITQPNQWAIILPVNLLPR